MNSDRKTRTLKIYAMQTLPATLLKRTVCACLLLGCCTACVDEENTQSLTVEKYRPLTIGAVNMEEELPGRAVLGNGAVIGLFLSNAAGVSSYTSLYNVKYFSDGTKWTSANPIMLGKENAAISAYHPYKDGNNPSLMVLKSQYYQDSEDISYAKSQLRNGTSTPTATVNFSMVRAYSQIEFELNRATTYDGNFKLTKIGIKHSGIIRDCYLDVATGIYSDPATDSNFSYIPGGGSGIGGGKEEKLTSSVLMVPLTSPLTGKFTISLTIDGTENTVDINALPLVAGTKYKVIVKVEGIHKITVSQVTVEDWLEVPITPEYPL